MRIFIWEENVLRNYRPGLVVVVAETEDQAREMAIEATVKAYIDNRAYLQTEAEYWEWNDSSRAEWVKDNGLDAPPDRILEIAPVVIWTEGGD